MAKKKRTWHLLAMANNEENRKLAMEETYARITNKYILVYTISTKRFDKKAQDVVLTYKELNAANLRFLSERDVEWLFEVVAEELKHLSGKEEAEMIADMSDKLNKLEAELEKVAVSTQIEGDNAEQQSDERTE